MTNTTDRCAETHALNPKCQPLLSLVPGTLILFAYILALFAWRRMETLEWVRRMPSDKLGSGVGAGIMRDTHGPS